MTRPSMARGAVVLAAFKPDPELFTVQLTSIRDQTLRDFMCLIGADGGEDDVRRLVRDAVGDDPRFEVLGWDHNVGFYLNFERLLSAVPKGASWVAMSDQDDRWHLDKLEKLVPLLKDAPLATGQARIITWPKEDVLLDRTDRKVVPAEDLLFQNQVTGGLSVLRRELLDVALPFPRLFTVTQLHDHWLALCAVSTGGYVVHHETVQDYVQHGGNIIGEVGVTRPAWTARRVLTRWVGLAKTYEQGSGPKELIRVSQKLSFQWRRVMLQTLAERVDTPSTLPDRALLLTSGGRWNSLRALWQAARSGNVEASVVATFVAGLPGEMIYAARRNPSNGDRRELSPRVER